MQILVYDHSYSEDPQRPGPLQQRALEAGLQILGKDARHVHDTSAADELLQSGAEAYFVHVDTLAWKKLSDFLPSTKWAVRFSTEQLGPTPRGQSSRGVVHCVTKVHDLSQREFMALTSLFLGDGQNEDLVSIRRGVIPSVVRGLISYKEAHELTRLYILLQGVLATWAADDGDEHSRARARRSLDVLSLRSTPPPPPTRFDSLEFLRTCLGVSGQRGDKDAKLNGEVLCCEIAAEVGHIDLSDLDVDTDPYRNDTTQFLKLSKALLTESGAGVLPEDVCFGAFAWLRRMLDVE